MQPAVGDRVTFRHAGATCYGQVLAMGHGNCEVVELKGSKKPGRTVRVRLGDIGAVNGVGA